VFRNVEARPNRVEVGTDNLEIRVTLLNRGQDDEDEAGFRVYNDRLGIDEERFDIELDESRSTTKTLPIFNTRITMAAA